MNEIKNKDDLAYIRKRKIFSIISITVIFVIAVLLTVFIWKWLSSFSQDGFRAYIQSFGPWGWIVLLGLQIMQVFVALIPGELLESAAGYAFGPFVGTIICYAGVVIGTAFIFFLTRKFGVKLVEIFISTEKINELRFINTESKRNGLVFLLFFIPGTPKDLFTYFIGLTDIKFTVFLIISLAARFPSVISSTFGGYLLGEERYIGAILLYSITGAVSLCGLLIYNRMLKRRNCADLSESEQLL